MKGKDQGLCGERAGEAVVPERLRECRRWPRTVACSPAQR